MRIERITLANFGSFQGKHTFQLADRGLCLVLGDNQDEPRMNSNGCLVGDTLIDGPRDLIKYPKGIPIRDLVGKRPWVYAWEDGRIVVKRASKVWLTKRRARVVRVKLSKYATNRGAGQGSKYLPPQELVGTPEHPVLLSDGVTWKGLGDLQPGDRLCSLYRRESGGWRTLLYWTGSGVMSMGDKTGPRTVSEQQFVCSETQGPRPEGMEVHHRNDKPYDHRPVNLEWKKVGEHQSYHTSKRNRLGLAGWKVSDSMRKVWQNRKRAKGPNHTVVSVEPAGYRDVYDMRVPGPANFVANGVVVHNSGKSTIFDALDWCLFGKVPRDDHVDSIVNEVVGSDCEVDVELLDDDGKHILVRRYRNVGGNNGCMLIVDGKELTSLDVKETQKDIERLLGLDRDVFHAAVLFGQTDLMRFADSKDSERMEVLTKILQLDEIDQWLEATKRARQEASFRHEQLERDINDRRSQIAMAESQLPNLRVQMKHLKDERANVLRETTVALTRHMENVPKYEKNVALEPRIRAALGAAEVNLQDVKMTCVPVVVAGEPPPFDDAPFSLAFEAASALETQWFAKREQIGADGKRVGDLLKKMNDTQEGECPECWQQITADHLMKKVVEKGAERETLRQSWQTVDREYQTAVIARKAAAVATATARAQHGNKLQVWQAQKDAHMEAQRVLELEVQKAQHTLTKAQGEVERIENEKRSLTQTLDYIAELKQKAEETRTKPNPYEVQLDDLEALVAGVREQLDNYVDELAVEKETLSYYDFWVEGFGPKGLKSYILDHRLQEMTEAANHWVKILTGGTIWVRFETQTMGRSTKKLSNKINVRVFRYNPDGSVSERNYRSWSGGEKQRVSLGVDFGLSRLIANRSRKRYDLLILDELFRHLDQGGREAVIEMLHHLRREKSSVIVVDHDSEFQGAFENRVIVRKHNQCSVIEEIDDAPTETPHTSRAPQADSVRAEATVS